MPFSNLPYKETPPVTLSVIAPTTVTLSASGGYFQAAKYSVQTPNSNQSLNATMDHWYAGNILFGALIDPATGAMWKLPKEVHINE